MRASLYSSKEKSLVLFAFLFCLFLFLTLSFFLPPSLKTARKYGKERMDLHALLGKREWQEAAQSAESKPGHVRLLPDLTDVAPEMVLGTAQYERGFQFLCFLQVSIITHFDLNWLLI